MSHTVNDVLRMAGHLLADERRRATRYLATRESGLPCKVTDPTACCWCLEGAIDVCAKTLKVPFWASFSEAQVILGHQELHKYWDGAGDHDSIAAKLRLA